MFINHKGYPSNMVVLITTKVSNYLLPNKLCLWTIKISYYRSHSKALKIIPSPFCAVSAFQCLWVSHDGMRIDVIRYELLTLSLISYLFKFFFQQSLIFIAAKQTWHHTKPTKQTFCTVQDKTTIFPISKFLAQDNDFPAFWLVP